ncbi:MAG: hypothetical protein IKJ65_03765 [Clostridia bacterium]|nr:hypothetical protein [Clostridia bacterium]
MTIISFPPQIENLRPNKPQAIDLQNFLKGTFFFAHFGLTANNLTVKAGKAKIAIIGVTSNQHHKKQVPSLKSGLL